MTLGRSPAIADFLMKKDAPLDIREGSGESVPSEIVKDTIKQMTKDIGGGATPREEEDALMVAQEDMKDRQAGGRGLPELEQAKKEIAENPNNVGELLSRKTGSDRVTSLGALISLVLPVVAGMAVGGRQGKRIAARGVVGAGTELQRGLLEDEKRARDLEDFNLKEDATIRQENRADERLIEKEGRALENAKELARYKKSIDPGEGGLSFEEKKARKVEMTRAETRARNEENRFKETQRDLDKLNPIIGRGRHLLEEAREVFGANEKERKQKGIGWFDRLVGRKVPSDSKVSLVTASIRSWATDVLKQKQGGRPSDKDMEIVLELIEGGTLTGPAGALARFERAIEEYESYRDAKEKILAERDMTDEEVATVRSYEAKAKEDDEVSYVVKTAAANGKSFEDVKKALATQGVKLEKLEWDAILRER